MNLRRDPKAWRNRRQVASVACLAVAFAASTLPRALHVLAGSCCAQLDSPARQPPSPETAVITGIVVNERREPVARAQVQAFAARTVIGQGHEPSDARSSVRASGSASTDAAGRFRIAGLPPGEYLVAASPVTAFPASSQARLYATTFYPSAIDQTAAVSVSAVPFVAAPISIQLVPVKGARISGTVLSAPGGSTEGMRVNLFQRFGNFGGGAPVGTVGANGAFETRPVPPGWYRIRIERPTTAREEIDPQFATAVIHVADHDVEGLSLVAGPGASISGRIAAHGATKIQSFIGFQVKAFPSADEYSAPWLIYANVAEDSSFTMTGLSGSVRFAVATDRPPFLSVARISMDGIEMSGDAGIRLTDTPHDVVLFVAPRDAPAPPVDRSLSTRALVEAFQNARTPWEQFTIGKEIVNRHDASVLASLLPLLSHDDRHKRGNAAFVFAALGDPRGFQIISEMLNDRSDRGPGIITGGNWTLRAQIRSDRYYAAHLLGDLRNPNGVPVLVPLLGDTEINSIVPWSLGQIGDGRAIGPLLQALDEDDPSMRVRVIDALEALRAKEALPRLVSLLADHRRANIASRISVSEAATRAIAALRQ